MELDTSLEAFLSVKESLPSIRDRMYEFVLVKGGATCDLLEFSLGLRHQTASARITELLAMGLIRDSGLRDETRSGRKAVIWEVVI